MGNTGARPAVQQQLPGPSAYDQLAGCYDWLAQAYTWGAMERAKCAHLPWLDRGDRALYVGAGTGAEAVEAARRGVQVTLVDQSEAMLSAAQRRFQRAGLMGTFLRADVRRFSIAEASPPGTNWDAVIAPFFLNVFSTSQVGSIIGALSRLVRPGGLLIVADFRAPTAGWFGYLQRLYYLPPLWLFWHLTSNPLHPLYDYPAIAQRAAPWLQAERRAITSVLGAPLLETVGFVVTAPTASP